MDRESERERENVRERGEIDRERDRERPLAYRRGGPTYSTMLCATAGVTCSRTKAKRLDTGSFGWNDP